MPFAYPILVVAAYLLGSIPTGYLLMRLIRKEDIRAVGSGNIGATNVLRSGGKGLGALTFLLDMGKGCASVGLGALLWWLLLPRAPLRSIEALAALCAVLGHLFPVWLGFKGGKGVATSGGILLAYAWPVGLAAAASWLLVAVVTRYSSLAALVACVLAPVYAWLLTREFQPTEIVGFLSLVVILRHHANIRRLLRGEEGKIKLRKG